MSILRSLAPFIAYAILSAFLPELTASAIALAMTIVLIAVALRTRGKPAEMVIDFSSAVFFAGYTVLSLIAPDADLGRWVGATIQFWLGIIVIVTMLIRRPFTLPIAKTQAPREIRDTPEFFAFNMKITGIWAACFIISGLIVVTLVALGHAAVWMTILIMVLAIVIPVRYTSHLVKGAQL